FWSSYVWQAGGDVFEPNAFPTRATFDSAAAQEGFGYFASLWTEHRVVPTFADRQAVTGANWFSRGTAGMGVFPTSFIGQLKVDSVDFEWDVAPVATGPT